MKRNSLFSVLLAVMVCCGCAQTLSAQITIPNTFTANTVASADKVNANFTALATNALNRTGGTITGNVTVSSGVTVDGVDISAAWNAGNPQVVSVQFGDVVGTRGGAIYRGSNERVEIIIPGTALNTDVLVTNSSGAAVAGFLGSGETVLHGFTYYPVGLGVLSGQGIHFNATGPTAAGTTSLVHTTVGATQVLRAVVAGTTSAQFAANTLILPSTVVWSDFGTGDQKDVSAGANDSAGVGYRLLRVPNTTPEPSPAGDALSLVALLTRIQVLEFALAEMKGGVR